MTTTTDPLDALLYLRDGETTARWNFADAVGSPVSAPGGLGNAVSLSYSFLSAPPSYFPTTGFGSFSTAARDATREVLDMVSSVARVAFSEVAGVGTMTFGMNAQTGSAGYAYGPSFGYSSSGGNIVSVTAQSVAGDVWLDSGQGWTTADFAPGGNGRGTLVHEVGHALGLKHPFEASSPGGYTLDAAHDNKAWTVMSYTEHPHGLFRTVTDNGGGSYSWRYDYIQPETLMPYDIAALQYLYGANTSWHTGNDSYGFDPARPFIKTINDAGGADTISVANFSKGCVIDLRDGHFSSIRIPSDALPPGQTETYADIYDGTDNLAIAFGVVIENATGGAGADLLTGNAVANVLNGGAGIDTMAGGDGSDTYYVAQSGDSVSETGTSASIGGTDTVCSSLPTYTLGSNVENGRIDTTASASITGNSLNNVLTAGAGSNTLNGGTGTDTASYSAAGSAVTVSLVPTGAQATGGSGSDTLIAIESLIGSAYNDKLTGSSAGNTLNGGTGADTLTGGDGNDTYYVDNGADQIIESNASAASGGTDLVYSSLASYTLGANVENGRINTSASASITGNSLNNVLTAGAGSNTLNGGTGTDTASYSAAGSAVTVSLLSTGAQATGGSGSDTLIAIESLTGSAYNDKLTGSNAGNTLNGGAGADTLTGGDGSDAYYVDSSADQVIESNASAASGGTDLVYSSLASYTLGTNLENGRIDTTASASITGNSLNNVLTAGAGSNTLNGGTGTDTASYSAAGSAVTVSLVPTGAQATGGSGSDTLIAIESLIGSAYNDKLTGSSAGNTLNGGTGADTLTGGDGNDTYYVDNGADQIIESNASAASGGTDLVYSSLASYTLGANVENGRINTSAVAGMTGNGLNNVIRAGAGNNTLDGGSGTDTVDYGSAGTAITVSLASAAAQITGGSGSDTISLFENLIGSAYNDTLTGGSGANDLTGAAGSDRLTGGAGADRFILNSLSGSDTLTDFASASDKVVVSQAAIRVGDGDTAVEGAVTKSGPGGFLTSAELVVITGNISGSITTTSAAAKIGSAISAYSLGADVLFMVDNGAASALYLFTAAGADAVVSSIELILLATLSATPAALSTDLLFGA